MTYNESGIFRITEYAGVAHAIMELRDDPEPEYLKASYGKLCEHLKLHKTPDLGITILLHQSWLFIAPLSDPFTKVNGEPVFIDPLAYVGILNVNIETHSWPQTAGHDVHENTPLDLLRISMDESKLPEDTIIESVVEPEEEEEEKQEGEGEGEEEEAEKSGEEQ